MSFKTGKILSVLAILLCYPCNVFGVTLSTTFSEVMVENLQPGAVYSMEAIASYPLKVVNKSEKGVKLKIEVVYPKDGNLREGFEKIPDLSWVRIEKEDFTLEPGETAVTDITISVPRKKGYFGKKYQVNIWSHTLGSAEDGVLSFAAGLESILLFTTDKVKRKISREKTGKINLNFDLSPRSIFVKDVKLGEVQDIKELTGEVLKIYNTDKVSHTYKVRSLSVEESLTRLKMDYQDCPDPSCLTFSESEFTVPPKETKEIKMYLNFPDKMLYRNERYMFIIDVSLKEEGVSGGVISRIYVMTE